MYPLVVDAVKYKSEDAHVLTKAYKIDTTYLFAPIVSSGRGRNYLHNKINKKSAARDLRTAASSADAHSLGAPTLFFLTKKNISNQALNVAQVSSEGAPA